MSARHLSAAERQRLVALLGMLGSDQPGERDNAARLAEKFRRQYGMTWADLLNLEALPPEPPPRPKPQPEPPPQPKPKAEAPRPPPPPKQERPRQPPKPRLTERAAAWFNAQWEPNTSRAGKIWGSIYVVFMLSWPVILFALYPGHHAPSPRFVPPPSRQVVHAAPAATPPRLAVPSTAPPTPWGISPVVR